MIYVPFVNIAECLQYITSYISMFKQLKLWYIQFSKKSLTFLCTFKKNETECKQSGGSPLSRRGCRIIIIIIDSNNNVPNLSHLPLNACSFCIYLRLWPLH